jgi:CelD/BcsL family acetyltransferase involved in cellulose biosynthesis
MAKANLSVTLQPASAYPGLKADWQDLEHRAESTVFLSWQWLGHWLATYKPAARVLKVTEGERIIGLGLLVETSERRHGVLKSHCLRLHQTGQRLQDQIWIEYNGFLSEKGEEDRVVAASLKHICEELPEWDEFIVGAIDSKDADRYAQLTGLHKHIRWEAPCFGVNLDELRRGGVHYLDTLSRNTRYQINRCERLYQQRGQVQLQRPDSVEGALALFDRIGPRHLQRWGSGADQSGFANPDFVHFHRELIRTQWADGGIDLVSLMAGDQEIASFYNLLHKGVIYFYLGGMETETDNRLKPGLLGHTLCIEDYRHHGFHYYDFMGGEERYKTNLGQLHRQLTQVSLQRGRFKLKLEDAARRTKQLWLKETAPNER